MSFETGNVNQISLDFELRIGKRGWLGAAERRVKAESAGKPKTFRKKVDTAIDGI
jgi:hypothetical protein